MDRHGFSEELQAGAADRQGQVLLAPLEMFYGQPG